MPFLKEADRSRWRKNYTSSKPIEQYDLQWIPVNTYYSIKEAARQTHMDEKGITQIAKGMYKQWNGFVWKYADSGFNSSI